MLGIEHMRLMAARKLSEAMLLIAIERGWFSWKVYALGHFEGDRTWLASFRHRDHAAAFVRTLGLGTLSDDPVNDVSASL